jgi:hypothetical protein
MKRALIVALLGAVAILAGYVAGLVVVELADWIAPFRDEDDDTLREYIPAALLAIVWVLIPALVFGLGLRLLLSRWRATASSDIQQR